MPRRPTIARKTKYAEQLTGTALTLDQFTNKLMHGGKRQIEPFELQVRGIHQRLPSWSRSARAVVFHIARQGGGLAAMLAASLPLSWRRDLPRGIRVLLRHR